MLALLLALALPVSQHPELLQPKTYVSPSGQWRLSVDPSSKFGGGPASVAVTHAGVQAWHAELPFTYWEAAITDAGYAAGYAFTTGRSARMTSGEFVVAIFGPDGTEVLQERVERTGSRSPGGPADPNPRGAFVQPALDRFVVRVADPDVNTCDETWWSYRLATGERLGRAHPKHALEDATDLRSSMSARAVQGTPLTIVQWYHSIWSENDDRERGTRFVLVDEDWRQVWSLALPRDFRHPDERTEDRLLDELFAHGSILAAGAPRRFELRHVAEQRRVTYEVHADPTAPGAWSVHEVARAPFVAPEHEALPVLELQALGSVPLLETQKVAAPIRDLLAFDFDAAGNICFVRSEADGAATLVSLNEAGAVTREVRIAPLEPGASQHGDWHPLPPGRWLQADWTYAEGEQSHARIIDGSSGAAREVEGVAGLTVEAVAGAPDGSFVVLGRYRSTHTSTGALFAFDADGRQRWSLHNDNDPEAEAALFSPADVAIDIDGSVIVFDNVREWLQVFDGDGAFVRKVDLEELWGEGGRYLTDLLVEPSGHWLLHDFHDPKTWRRIDRNGQLLASILPRRENGSSELGNPGNARIDALGRLWITDGHELAVLDEGGIARTRFGAPLDPKTLQEARDVQFDGRGRVALVDSRSHAVHLYGASGGRELVLVPNAADFEGSHAGDVRATAAGQVYVGMETDEDRHLCFSADGERVGDVDLGGERVVFLDNGERWAARCSLYGETFARRLQRDGTQRAKVARRPNNAFFEWIVAIDCTAEGALAVLAGGADGLTLDLFDPSGGPQRTIELHGAPKVMWRELVYGRRWIVISGYYAEALLVSLADGKVSVVRPAVGEQGTSCAFDLSPDGKELWCATLEPPALHRFALPE